MTNRNRGEATCAGSNPAQRGARGKGGSEGIMSKLKCPDVDCGGKLVKKPQLAEGVWECDTCLSRWVIIKTSDGKARR